MLEAAEDITINLNLPHQSQKKPVVQEISSWSLA